MGSQQIGEKGQILVLGNREFGLNHPQQRRWEWAPTLCPGEVYRVWR